MSNGESGSSGIPIVGPILDALASIFGGQDQVQGLAQQTSRVEQAAWANLINVASWSFGLFGGILDALGNLLKSLAKLFENLFGNIIWGFIKKIFAEIRDWIAKLRNWIRVHIAAWQKIQRQLDAERAKYMRKVLDIIQRIRKILVPFRLLHLKFAQQLDATLAGYESDLGRKWARMVAHENAVLGVLNDIVDPRQLLRPGHALGSAGLAIAAVHGAIGAASLRELLCLAPATAASPLVAPWSATRALLLSDWKGRTGDYAIVKAQADQALRGYALDGGTVSPV